MSESCPALFHGPFQEGCTCAYAASPLDEVMTQIPEAKGFDLEALDRIAAFAHGTIQPIHKNPFDIEIKPRLFRLSYRWRLCHLWNLATNPFYRMLWRMR